MSKQVFHITSDPITEPIYNMSESMYYEDEDGAVLTFEGVVFEEDFFMRNSSFAGAILLFNRCTFKGNVNFSSSVFEGLIFLECVFEKSVHIFNCVFQDVLDFTGGKTKTKITLWECTGSLWAVTSMPFDLTDCLFYSISKKEKTQIIRDLGYVGREIIETKNF